MPRPPSRTPAPQRPSRPRAERPAASGERIRAAAGLIYGLHPVAAAWTNPERTCHKLYATEAGAEALAEAVKDKPKLERPAPVLVDKAELDRVLPDAVHQGLALSAAPLPERDEDDVIRMVGDSPKAVLVVLDQVTDPHNVGAILRSAAAFGATAVLVTERHAPEVTGVLAKAASGALEVVPLVRVVNLSRALGTLKEAGFWCVGLAESGTRRLADLDLGNRVALVLGAEGSGLRRLTKERCDELVHLPTRGPIGSLNVSNAAAVALYETARLRS